MKVRVRKKDGKITKVSLISEDEGDRELLEALWRLKVKSKILRHRPGYVVFQVEMS